MRLLLLLVGFAFLGSTGFASPAPLRATVPAGFSDDSAWVTGLSYPTAMEFAPDGRLFVCQQGALGGAAFTWRVDFHHDAHIHPHMPDTHGSSSGSFSIPGIGETAANVWYRIHLTVTDAGGLTSSAYLDVEPVTVTLTIDSAPAGLQITLDGQPHAAPYSIEGVVGLQRTLGVVSPQSSAGSTHTFGSWSDGGEASHAITTPNSGTTWTATYTEPIAPAVSPPAPSEPAGAGGGDGGGCGLLGFEALLLLLLRRRRRQAAGGWRIKGGQSAD